MARGTDELTRVLRELFDRTNRLLKRTEHQTIVRIKGLPETPAFAERVELDNTQPSATPKWGTAATWSRSIDNVRWSEGAKWQ